MWPVDLLICTSAPALHHVQPNLRNPLWAGMARRTYGVCGDSKSLSWVAWRPYCTGSGKLSAERVPMILPSDLPWLEHDVTTWPSSERTKPNEQGKPGRLVVVAVMSDLPNKSGKLTAVVASSENSGKAGKLPAVAALWADLLNPDWSVMPGMLSDLVALSSWLKLADLMLLRLDVLGSLPLLQGCKVAPASSY
mmetsp:Transcript_25817/g.65716  ORF Transcript_25817/g.65716 Transcript_25817/m.65716 type:complete len:194 (-) Transcript_25817:239-820(-)